MSERCSELPLIKGWTTGSGNCAGLENQKMKGGTTAGWTQPEVPIENPPDLWWQDEETNLYVTLNDGETLIELT